MDKRLTESPVLNSTAQAHPPTKLAQSASYPTAAANTLLSSPSLPQLAGYTSWEQASLHLLVALEEAEKARNMAERMTDRLGKLQQVTVALSGARSLNDVVDVILKQGMAVVGAKGGEVALTGKSQVSIYIARSAGFPVSAGSAQLFPLEARIPIAQAVTTQQSVFLDNFSAIEQEFPTTAWIARQNGYSALAVLPFIDYGKVMGALSLAFADPQEFSETDRQFMLTVAQQCAQAVSRTMIYEDWRHSEFRYRRLVNANIMGILEVYGDGEIIEVNDAFLQMTGYSRSEANQKVINHRSITPVQYHELDEQVISNLVAGVACAPYEKEYTRKDGTCIPVLVGVTMLSNTWRSRLCFVIDLTQQKLAESALREAKHAKEEAYTRFLQVAAHELRNPMTALKGVCSIMQRRVNAGKPTSELPGLIEREIDRLSYMLNEILEAFKHERGLLVHKERMDIAEVIDLAMQCFYARDGHERFSINGLDTHIAVYGDPKRMEDVFRNLIGNAVKYSPPNSPITININTVNHGVQISFKDEGVGIPSNQLEEVFSGFYRASNVAFSGPAGLGLGLHICRDIVQEHNGRIWVESEEGRGAKFVVELPQWQEAVS